MDAYLDPQLSGGLAFLDPQVPLHPAPDPASLGSVGAFDYDQWLNDAPTAAYDAQATLAAPHGAGQALPHVLAPPAAPTLPFGLITSDADAATPRASPGALAPLAGPVAQAQPSPAALNLARPTTSSGAPDPSSYSIAAFGTDTSAASAGATFAKRLSLGSPAATLPSPQQSPRTAGAHARVPFVTRSPVAIASASGSSRPHLHQQSAVGAAGTLTPRTLQADESVPEAALHLLRLAQPDGSAGSVATNSTGGREDEISGDEDAEGESDDTSIHSIEQQNKRPLVGTVVAQQGQLETRVWLHNPDQPPLHVQRGGGPASRHPSVSESLASTRTGRPNIPARAQREASTVSNRSRALSDAASVGSVAHQQSHAAPPAPTRRTSGRVRKPRVVGTAAEVDSDDDEFRLDDAYGPDEDSDDSPRKKGKAAAVKSRKPAKRASTAADGPAKKARTSKAAAAPSPAQPRKARRQAFIPPNLQNRTLPPHVQISDAFPRFYRNFPVSSAFAPDSYVLKAPKASSSASSSHGGLIASTAPLGRTDPFLPTPTSLYDDSAFAAAQYYAGVHTPTASSSSSSLSAMAGLDSAAAQFSLAAYLPMPGYPGAGALPPTPGPSHHPQHHHHQHHPQHQQHLMSPALSTASSSVATAFSSSQGGHSTPPSTAASSAVSTSSVAATPTMLGPNGVTVMQPPPDAKWNKPSSPLNLYWPRFVRGNADDKCGMCPICAEPKERGGEGEQKWLKLKNSSYVYHMSYAHGLSNTTGLPFSPPLEMRQVELPPSTKDQRSSMTEGRCHKCDQWIPLLSIKNIDAIVPELIWWKHAKKCHGDSTIPGERDVYQQDEVYALVLQRRAEHGGDD
ncbi:hypothetical protein Rhopal_004650-T1 [Rhodotorula paludigena]|uniref:Transcription regulator Rua1 C-terminal domain-containing protein n=1 Tax=Rhodotorula paludigena TaxID=86838 RepID=A0AAV5GRF3_9BASI|nr:hypothetical protein Rhopal_004650-T1 [Rhodotorula paludigena]